jgi:hypothetical protein
MIQEFSQAACTSFLAVVVLVVGQIIIRFLIEPIYEQRKLIGEITAAIKMYANVSAKAFKLMTSYPTPPESLDEYQREDYIYQRKHTIDKFFSKLGCVDIWERMA